MLISFTFNANIKNKKTKTKIKNTTHPEETKNHHHQQKTNKQTKNTFSQYFCMTNSIIVCMVKDTEKSQLQQMNHSQSMITVRQLKHFEIKIKDCMQLNKSTSQGDECSGWAKYDQETMWETKDTLK